MERTVHSLAERVPRPQKISYKSSFVYRYVEKTAQQAMVQKLARLVTTLKSASLLMIEGLVQEQATLQRVMHEIHEDVTLLAYNIITRDGDPIHQKFLDAFYEEEFDTDNPITSTQKRPMVPRSKIQAYIAKKQGGGLDPCRGLELSRTVTKAYSGFIHAASPQIMDMYGGNPPHFHMQGLLGTERHREHREDLWNYYYRSIISFALAARAFEDEYLIKQIDTFILAFEKTAGKSYSNPIG